MTLLDNVLWSLKQIKSRMLESILIILGIGIGISVICGVVGILNGYNNQLDRIEDSLLYQIFEITPKQYVPDPSNGFSPLRVISTDSTNMVKLYVSDYFKIKEANFVEIDSLWFSESRTYYDRNTKSQYEYYMTTPDIFKVIPFNLKSGEYFGEIDMLNENKVAVIGERLAKKKFGDREVIGTEITLGNDYRNRYKIIGVYSINSQDAGIDYIPGLDLTNELDSGIIVPYMSYKWPDRSEGIEREIRQIYMTPTEQTKLKVFYDSLNLFVKNNYSEEIVVKTSFLHKNEIVRTRIILGVSLGIFASIVLLIAAINILNLMMARVIAREREIGIARSLGATKIDIFNGIIIESLIMALVGNVISIFLIFGMRSLLIKLTNLPFDYSPLLWGISTGFAILISVIFGLYPAYSSTQINIVDTIKNN